MTMTTTLFYILAGVITASALMVVTLRNLFHCALFLAVTMLGISGVFLYLGSEFLAAVQVLIYVGAVTVLVIFGIMLTRNVMDEKAKAMNTQLLPALAVAIVLGLITFLAVSNSSFQWTDHPTAAMKTASSIPSPAPVEVKANDVYTLGPELISPDNGFAFAFELVSILLLSALVGAIVVARKDPT
jgi:NADH-quinone oxidoreductase subunit J